MKSSRVLFVASLICLAVGLSQVVMGLNEMAVEALTGFGLAMGAVLFGLAFIARALAKAEEASETMMA